MQLSASWRKDSWTLESLNSCTVSACSTRDNSLAVCLMPRLVLWPHSEFSASSADRLKSGCCKTSSLGIISPSCDDAEPAE